LSVHPRIQIFNSENTVKITLFGVLSCMDTQYEDISDNW